MFRIFINKFEFIWHQQQNGIFKVFVVLSVIAFECKFYVSFSARVSTESTMSCPLWQLRRSARFCRKKHHPIKCINIGIYIFLKSASYPTTRICNPSYYTITDGAISKLKLGLGGTPKLPVQHNCDHTVEDVDVYLRSKSSQHWSPL